MLQKKYQNKEKEFVNKIIINLLHLHFIEIFVNNIEKAKDNIKDANKELQQASTYQVDEKNK